MITQTYRKMFFTRVLLLGLACLLCGNALAWEDGSLTPNSQDQVLLTTDITDDSDTFDSNFITAAPLYEFTKLITRNRSLPFVRINSTNIWNAKSIRAPPSPIK